MCHNLEFRLKEHERAQRAEMKIIAGGNVGIPIDENEYERKVDRIYQIMFKGKNEALRGDMPMSMFNQ